MNGRIPTRAAKLAAALVTAIASLAIAAGAASASGTVIYNSMPSPLPGNVPSQAFEATSTSEFGSEIETAGASQTRTAVKVGMSSWACQSGGAEDGSCVTAKGAKFEWPVTLHVYTVGPENSVGTLVAAITKTFKMPYRPSANATKCPGNGGWWNMGHCYHGKAFKIGFMLKGAVLPKPAIIAVAYNTSDYGAEPQRSIAPEGGPYDSLNVALTGTATVGSQPQPEDAYLDSTWGGAYCDGGTAGTGSFRLDSGCWSGFQPLITVETS
ncbi:MAG TPA: hypothetical protein VN672_09350 [Solirubrobacteraceae bacterium]|nr:hypothetical protein [Solirubrobacteraceae bacterium]